MIGLANVFVTEISIDVHIVLVKELIALIYMDELRNL
tara:strand:+ start:460 stop:570 length:111 start_codon:yes stop_codon:yes gene_type:complete